MAVTNSTLQTTAERLALQRAVEEHPSAEARIVESFEHINDGVWVVQVEVKDQGSIQTPYYSFDQDTNAVQNVFPLYSNLLR